MSQIHSRDTQPRPNRNPDLQVLFFLLDYPITEDNQTGALIDGVHLSKN